MAHPSFRALVAGLCLLTLPSLSHASILDDIPAGTGYTAHDLCTRMDVSEDRYWRVRVDYVAPKVQPLPLLWDIDVLSGTLVEVRTYLPFLTHRRLAVYREGLGCTMARNYDEAADLLSRDFNTVDPQPRQQMPWPHGEGEADDSRLSGEQADILQDHTGQIFSEVSNTRSEKRNAVALAVAMDGQLVFERYADGYHRDQPQLGWSMTKSLTALLVGMMVTEGRFSLDQPVGLEQWHGSEKAGITWKELLNMAPGLAWFEGYGGLSDATEMLFSQKDQGSWAASLPLESEPGTVFNYSTGTPNIAMLAMREKLGSAQAIYDYYQSKLFDPLGIRNGIIEPDFTGTPVGGARGILRPVDWLRLGQLVANHGSWEGQQLIAQPAMDFLLAPSPAAEHYGGFIWRGAPDEVPEDLRKRLPDDLVWFAGHMGQYTIVVPSENLVVLRMGVAFDEEGARNQAFALTADLIEAN
ncbi:MAG: hypothetical protein CL583_05455 [Alteromonadaceae bacterium]|nr:hypothetical protein [Alteromonadaceae bacterium]